MPTQPSFGPNLLRLLSMLAIATALAACVSTGVRPTLQAGLTENPDQGVAVRIARVVDERHFGDFAGRKHVPTLTGDTTDPERRARAIGRTTLTNGRPGANIFLEDDLTVEGLVSDAGRRALRAAGFRVLEKGDTGYEQAIDVELAIEQLWMMRSQPNASPWTEAELRIRISAPLPGLDIGQVVEARQKIVRGGFSRSMWRMALEQGLDDFTVAAQDDLALVVSAVNATPATQLATTGIALIPQAKTPEQHAVDFGRYYLLAIGIDDYQTLPRLKTAVSDARAVSSLLSQAYGFESELLVNATRADLIRKLTAYRDKVGPRDNLLIYYAGHGWNDEAADLGYWLPADADPDDETNWVSNAKITSILRAMQAKHVMVVSDSCYSGTLTRGLQISRKGPGHLERLAARRTRLALASGGNEPVVDGGGGKHSVFANAFLRILRENEEVLDATTLHARIRTPIMRDADQTPQFGPIRSARHEDGDFLFVRAD